MWFFGDDRTATLELCFGANDDIVVRHLDGIADDSFEVRVNGIKIGEYEDAGDTETWIETTFHLTKEAFKAKKGEGHRQPMTVTFEATGSDWSGFDTYGQVAIDWVRVEKGGLK